MFRIFRLDYALSSISLQVIRTTLLSYIFFPTQGAQKGATVALEGKVTCLEYLTPLP
jgi:hypothetical protein